MNNYEYLLSDISILKGVGKSLVTKFKRKNINTIFDLILSIPSKYIDRSNETKIKELHIGKIQSHYKKKGTDGMSTRIFFYGTFIFIFLVIKFFLTSAKY